MLPFTGLVLWDCGSVSAIAGTFARETAVPASVAFRKDLRETSSVGFAICGGMYHTEVVGPTVLSGTAFGDGAMPA